jgi:hypothetical protein
LEEQLRGRVVLPPCRIQTHRADLLQLGNETAISGALRELGLLTKVEELAEVGKA